MNLNYQEILFGKFQINELPSINPRAIRLFLCSPFVDTQQEANHLLTNVFPKLRDFSISRYGLEFQVVNLNFENKNIDKKLWEQTELCLNCLKEIKNCQNESIGMTFIALIGNIYGEPLLPKYFERNQFEIILKCLKENQIDTKNLETYYRLNINCLSNRYELEDVQSLSNELEKRFVDLLKMGTKLAVEKNLLDLNSANELEYSFLHKLLINGIFKNDSVVDKVFTYVKIPTTNITRNTMLQSLVDKDINYHVPVEQIYRVKTTNKIDEIYLNNFGEYYRKLFENLIEKFAKKNQEAKHEFLIQDVLYHLHHIKQNNFNELCLNSHLHVMKTLRDYIFENGYNQPLILTGPSGCGKTTHMATLASNVYFQFMANNKMTNQFDLAVIIRFIGIDGKSIYLRNLLKSICLQLKAIISVKQNDYQNESLRDVPTKLNELKIFFKNLLTKGLNVSKSGKRLRLVILLDSLQDLSKEDNSYKLDWLPKYLNSECKLILSVSSDCDDLIRRLKKKYTNDQNYVSLSNLDTDQTNYMIRKLLNKKNQRLQTEQMNFLLDFVKNKHNKNVLPLHLKLLSEEFLYWKSYTEPDNCILKETIESSILYFIDKLENRFGHRLVKYILCYITISYTGFSELELQDILSLENILVRDLKSKDLIQENQNVLRIPWILIFPILDNLRSHLINRPFHGLNTFHWRHQIYKDIIFKKYLNDNKKLEEHLHQNVSEYYLGTWSNSKPKHLQYEKVITSSVNSTNQQLRLDKPKVKVIKTYFDRQIPAQPLRYNDFHALIEPRYNLRKLSLLPYHLSKANMIKELLNGVYFNVEWLYSKLIAFDLQQLLYDFELYKDDFESNLVCESIKMSESEIIENPKAFFNEISGRLIPFYHLYNNIRKLIDQCDEYCHKMNPLMPIGQINLSPSCLQENTVNMDIDMKDELQLELIENDFNGRILFVKNLNSEIVKFYDLDLSEPMNEVKIGKGKVYCSLNGDYVCYIQENKFIIRRVETGELYGVVNFEPEEIGHVYISSNYAAITFRKSSSPLIIDIGQHKILNILPYHTCFCCFSPDDKVLLIHSEKMINYYLMPTLERKICLNSSELPQIVQFSSRNDKIFVLTKDTKQIIYYELNLEKNYYRMEYVLQDRDIINLKLTNDDSYLLVCSLNCIYVLDAKSADLKVLHKLKNENLNSTLFLTNFDLNRNSTDLVSNSLSKSVYTGFGCTLDNKIVYATLYTFLVCYDLESGQLIRLFQSTLSANRILKSYTSRFTDSLVSLLDNGELLIWNLKPLKIKSMNFEDTKAFSNSVNDCVLATIPFDSKQNSSLIVSYSSQSPDAKVHCLKNGITTKSILKNHYDLDLDDPLTVSIKLCVVDPSGRYCFIVNNVENFVGKRLPDEINFLKVVCSLIDLTPTEDDGDHNDEEEKGQKNSVIDKFSYIVRKNSRFEIDAKFINKNSNDQTYLLVKITSCINDFDPFYENSLDWTDFETNVKLFGPIRSSTKLELFDEFKLPGESLSEGFCITTNSHLYMSLMHECTKLYEKNDPSLIIAKRYSVRLNIYDLFESKTRSLPVQLFGLNELLPNEHFNNKNIFLDVRQILNDGLALIVYSKQGAIYQSDNNESNSETTINDKYEYIYEKFRFNRNISTEKGAIIYDPVNNKVRKIFTSIFSKETNVETLKVSNSGHAIDNNWILYDLNNGKPLRKLNKEKINFDMSFKFAKFIFDGRYLVSSSENERKLHIIRCYDSYRIASANINGKVSCVSIGECDRTILVGTKCGNLLAFTLLIDLETNDAITNHIEFYRNRKIYNNKLSHHKSNRTNDKENMLNNDLKRVINSAHAHRQLQVRESRLSFSSSSNLNTLIFDTNNNNNSSQPIGTDSHTGICKSNLVNLTSGIKYINSNVTTRACIIQ